MQTLQNMVWDEHEADPTLAAHPSGRVEQGKDGESKGGRKGDRGVKVAERG